ncbi:MAG TPA: FxsA family protein [Micromonosporaceae bacterium]|nr:FxsA family protein [Micromonosporaceae bacterium]
MRWLGYAAVAAAILVVAEIAAFVLVAKAIGVGWALAIGFLTTLLGGWLLRREGVRGWRRFRAALDEGRAPGDEASNGLLGLVGALLLVLPGFVGSVIGLVLLLPPVRALSRRALRHAAERRVTSAVAGGVFGARRVRAYRGPSSPGAPPGTAATPPPSADPVPPPGGPGRLPAAIEGEIVDPDHRA